MIEMVDGHVLVVGWQAAKLDRLEVIRARKVLVVPIHLGVAFPVKRDIDNVFLRVSVRMQQLPNLPIPLPNK